MYVYLSVCLCVCLSVCVRLITCQQQYVRAIDFIIVVTCGTVLRGPQFTTIIHRRSAVNILYKVGGLRVISFFFNGAFELWWTFMCLLLKRENRYGHFSFSVTFGWGYLLYSQLESENFGCVLVCLPFYMHYQPFSYLFIFYGSNFYPHIPH